MKRKISIFSLETQFDKQEAKKFFEELGGGSPGATAIVGHAYLHGQLQEVLKKRLIKDEKLLAKMDDLNFEICLNLCYLTGTISIDEFADLKIISFMKKLNIPTTFRYNTSKDIFASEITLYSLFLGWKLIQYERLKGPKTNFVNSSK